MRTYECTICGEKLTLCLNGAALSDAYDKLGTDGFLLDRIRGGTRKAFNATCWLLWKLAEQGELLRRWQGQDRQPVPSEGFFRLHMRPADVLAARAAIEEAFRLGFLREIQDKDGIDLGLAELEKKTTEAAGGPSI